VFVILVVAVVLLIIKLRKSKARDKETINTNAPMGVHEQKYVLDSLVHEVPRNMALVELGERTHAELAATVAPQELSGGHQGKALNKKAVD
jgi:hypothetical protein